MTNESHDLLMEHAPQTLRKSFSFTLEDFVRTQLIMYQQKTGAKAPWKSAVFIWGMLTSLGYVIRDQLIAGVLLAIPPALLAYAFLRWMPAVNFRNYLKYYFGPGPYSVQIELGESQLIYVKDDYEQRFQWSAASRLVVASGELQVYFAKFALIRIPDSVFSGENEKREWMNVLEQKTGLSFS